MKDITRRLSPLAPLPLSLLAAGLLAACPSQPNGTGLPDLNIFTDTTVDGSADAPGPEDVAADADAGTDAGADASADAALDGGQGDAVEDAAGDGSAGDGGAGDAPDGGCANECTEGETRCAETGEQVEVCKLQGNGCYAWSQGVACLTTNLCTNLPDVCVDGKCQPPAGAPDPNAGCTAPEDPCLVSVCNGATGQCEDQPNPEPVPCDDGDVCTEDDVCFNGECGGTDVCPKTCVPEDLLCGEAIVGTLTDGTNTMDGYSGLDGACADATTGYEGFERVFKVQTSVAGTACEGSQFSVELTDPSQAGTDFVDVFLLDPEEGTCWPGACLDRATMDGAGRLTITADLPASGALYLVVDGREGYNGEFRVAASCCGKSVETFCGDGVDQDGSFGDGLKDCADDDCAGDPLCDTEYSCTDGLDNDGNGATDCFDPACTDAPECDVETDCADTIDNDGNGQTDCDDPSCQASPDCAQACSTVTATLHCGDTLTNQDLTTAPIGILSSLHGGLCSSGSGDYSTKHQLAYELDPGTCDGNYEVQIVPSTAGSNLILDTILTGPDCLPDACVAEGFLWGQDPAFLGPLTTTAHPTAWLLVSEAVEASQLGNVDITLNCTCQ